MIRPSCLLACAFGALFALAPASTPTFARTPVAPVTPIAAATRIEVPTDTGSVRITLRAANVVHLSALVDGKSPARSMVLDPALQSAPTRVGAATTSLTLISPQVHVRYDRAAHSLSIADARDHVLLQIPDVTTLAHCKFSLGHAAGDPMYGVSGYDAFTDDVSAGLLRQGKLEAKAGEQGWAGAPLAWSTAGYAVLADIDGGHFTLASGRIDIAGPAKPLDVYVIIGAPKAIFAAVADLSGHTPLFPKWAMGFTNSQWGIDQKELLQIVDTYRAKHIPIDNITLDFDWKAWGEDDYGEFRWNPVKFPDGPSGALKRQMDARGIRLTGIMKPRIHVDTVEGRYATAHDFWVPGEKVSDDYFSHKPVKNIDFDIPAARHWFGELAIKYGYDDGIAGWWNDEADTTGSDTEFMNMQRALYDSQRAVSNERVWSINRNFWLGSQRYAYGLWSGDIDTGFASMAGQRARMLSAIDVGAMQWGMDGGGFRNGTPTPENYARWLQFGAFTPIFRVHGEFGQKRQPWVYGPLAEKAATAAIRLRYALIPYIYSYEHARRVDGVGLVRPLLFDWPHDPQVRNDVDSWLFGDWLLVSPVVAQGQATKDVYLPAGRWIDWFSGKAWDGGQTIRLAIDNKTWSDIPLFIRDGAIIPNRSPEDHVGQHPLTELDVDIFPAAQRSTFDYYDDDGSTYDYEHGAYFLQSLSAQRKGDTVQLDIAAASGSFRPALRHYLLKIHGSAAASVGQLKSFANLDALQQAKGEGWASGHDRYGEVTWVRVAAARATSLTLDLNP